MKTIQIKHRYTGTVLYSTDVDYDEQPIRTAVERAARSYADLDGANLSGADLYGANLSGAEYRDAPLVRNLDRKILRAIESGEGSLYMGTWHSCETTHCRAGWAVALAGKAGRDLEIKIGTAAAGALIYQRSTGRIPNFYASDEDALADIVACAHDQGANV
jgi:uncharacterized protein YjbI with pentapeptide repeats